jgi:hypothetical protein
MAKEEIRQWLQEFGRKTSMASSSVFVKVTGLQRYMRSKGAARV